MDIYTAVLLYMEKLGIIESAERWKEIRELRNAVNHDYEEEPERLAGFFSEPARAAPQLLGWHERLVNFCASNYGLDL